MAKQQSRSYVVNVIKHSSGEIMENEVFPADSNPLKAKTQALKKAKSLVKQYSDYDGNVSLFVAVYVDEYETLFLDQNGDEDTKQTDWLD